MQASYTFTNLDCQSFNYVYNKDMRKQQLLCVCDFDEDQSTSDEQLMQKFMKSK